jgi:putative effector of murein hydrolase LrgA (UPF0299 family)
MIIERTGNIFTTKCQTIVNTVNCVGVMGAGIAYEFRLRYQDMFNKYKQHCEDKQLDIGILWIYNAEDKKILNFLVIIVLSFITFWWTSFIFHLDMAWNVIATIIGFRILASLLIFKDFSLSWSKSTQKTFLIKTIVVGVPTVISMGVFYGNVER